MLKAGKNFVSAHTKYYPALVQEFYANIYEDDKKLYTTVNGKHFQVNHEMLASALGILDDGALVRVSPVSLKTAHYLMTGQDPEGLNVDFILYNANYFPPLQ